MADFGLLTHAELLELHGVDRVELAGRLRRGELEKVRRGRYSWPEELDARARHWRLVGATVGVIGQGSVVSHVSAAVLHGLPLPHVSLERVWVTRPLGGNGRRGSVLHLRKCAVAPDEVVLIDGIPVTSLARTAIDLARLLAYEWGVIACDAALNQGLPVEELRDSAASASRRPGVRRAVAASLFADGRAASPVESLSRLQMFRLGLPTPELQFQVIDRGRVVATTDFGWESERLVGEADGRVKYGELLRPGQSAADAVMAEKRREERIRLAAYWIVRWGWAEASDIRVFEQVLRRAFELAPRLATSSRESAGQIATPLYPRYL